MFYVGDDLNVAITATNKSSLYTALIQGYFTYNGETQTYLEVLQPNEVYVITAVFHDLQLGTSTLVMGGDYVNSVEVSVYPVGYGITLSNLRLVPSSGWVVGDSVEVKVDVTTIQLAHELDNPSYRIMCMDSYWAQIQNNYVNINGSGVQTSTFTFTNLQNDYGDHNFWVIDFINFSEHILCQVSDNIIGACNSLPETDQTTSSFVAHWDTPTGRIDGYFVDVDDSYSFISYTRYDVGLVNSYEVTGYPTSPFGPVGYYRVMGYNLAVTGTSADYEQFDLLPVAPAKPYTPTLWGNLFGTSMTVVTQGNSEDQSTSYYYYFWDLSIYSDFSVLIEDKVKEFGYGVKTHGFTGLTPGVTYYYRCYARRGTDPEWPYSPASDSNSQMTPLPAAAPTGTTATSITKTSFQMNFTLPAGATHTLVSVSLYADFHNFVEPWSDLYIEDPPRNYKSITSLTAGTDYYYRLYCQSAGGDTPYSNVVSTRTLEATPGAPNIGSGTDMTVSSFYANWTAGTGVVSGYYLDVSVDNFVTFIVNNQDVGNVLTHQVTGLNSATYYQFRVRAYNNGGYGGNSSTSQTVTTEDAPVTRSLQSSEIGKLWATLHSSAAYTAYLFYWDVSTVSNFSSFVWQDHTGGYNYETISILTAGTTYYYRVRAFNGTMSDYSNVSSFVTLEDVPTPTQGDITDVTYNGMTLNWNDVGELADMGYYIDVARDVNFTDFFVNEGRIMSHTTISKTYTTMAQGTQYWARIKSHSTNGDSDWSNVKTQTTSVNDTIYLTWSDTQTSTEQYDCQGTYYQFTYNTTACEIRDINGTLINNPYAVDIQVSFSQNGTQCGGQSYPTSIEIWIAPGTSSNTYEYCSGGTEDCGQGCEQFGGYTSSCDSIVNTAQVPRVVIS